MTERAALPRVMPVEPASVVSLTAWPDRAEPLAAAVDATFGVTLPDAGRWAASGGLTAIWSGPCHWTLQHDTLSSLSADLHPVVADHGALIDISDARAIVRIGGAGVTDMLSRLLPIDLHPRAFSPGCAASTVAAHLSVQVRQLDDAPTYELSCLRSYATALWRALDLAGAGRL